ncbi:competence protein CoiA [Psychroflexus salinarum]|uniref:Competence protein CoiA n=1 Tax=Psychroflexus salinarum TaxID=546024 RepID=A0ABW3GL17_9FLAO
MLLALSDKTLIPPFKNTTALCPLCESKVVSKCGEINIHHWAHKNGEGCDSWSEPETYWHKSWKESFPLENREVVIDKQGKKHFADLCIDNDDGDIVIELQNSSISSETIKEREDFYGERMLWVINGARFRESISICSNLSLHERILGDKQDHPHIGMDLSFDNINEILKTSKEFPFCWKNPVRSWLISRRPVFLDIGEDYILKFNEGLGANHGTFRVYPKHTFFKKYKGDYSKYQKLNDRERLIKYSDLVNIARDVFFEFDSDFKTYRDPPFISLQVYNNQTKKTCLNRVRWKELIIPNGNSKGLFFMFCVNLKNPNLIGLYAQNAKNETIKKNILEIIEKDDLNSFYHIDNTWKLDCIASIPFNNSDNEYLSQLLLEFFLKNIRQRIMDNNKMEIIKITDKSE